MYKSNRATNNKINFGNFVWFLEQPFPHSILAAIGLILARTVDFLFFWAGSPHIMYNCRRRSCGVRAVRIVPSFTERGRSEMTDSIGTQRPSVNLSNLFLNFAWQRYFCFWKATSMAFLLFYSAIFRVASRYFQLKLGWSSSIYLDWW